jgi:hypothetical protein
VETPYPPPPSRRIFPFLSSLSWYLLIALPHLHLPAGKQGGAGVGVKINFYNFMDVPHLLGSYHPEYQKDEIIINFNQFVNSFRNE